MAKFDVHRLRDSSLVVDCQSDLLSDLQTRFIIPLFAAEGSAARVTRLNPVVEFAGSSYVLAPQAAATIRRVDLGPSLGSLAEHDLTIGNALDMLISGF